MQQPREGPKNPEVFAQIAGEARLFLVGGGSAGFFVEPAIPLDRLSPTVQGSRRTVRGNSRRAVLQRECYDDASSFQTPGSAWPCAEPLWDCKCRPRRQARGPRRRQ